MEKFLKLKAIAILVGGGIASCAYADNSASMNNSRTANTQVTTQNVARNDAAITTDVNTALGDYSGMVTASVKDAVVYLAGELPSDTDYDKVVTLAESVKGVSDVNVDKLTVKDSKQPLYDSYITGKVKGSLIQADLMGKDVPGWSISVETKDNQVFLSGTVKTPEEKQNIINVVKSVKGVLKVNDQITVGADNNGTNADTNSGVTTDTNTTTDTTTPDNNTNTAPATRSRSNGGNTSGY